MATVANLFSLFFAQNRYFKINSRPNPFAERDGVSFFYTLMWYKNKGGAVIKSADLSKVRSVALLESSRQLAYNYSKMTLMLSSEVREFI